jgi:hypothetical protein
VGVQYLPDPEEQKWLIHYMRRLIERAGWQRFVRGPIFEPTRKWFPEPWSGTVRDAHIVTQRLLHYAGIGQLRPILDSYASIEGEEGERYDWAAYYSGIEGDRVKFAIRLATLADPEIAAGTMAHEVAHAWRTHHRLVADSREREELLTDVTTVYLGFGVMTTNDTYRFRSSGNSRQQQWSQSRYGYLPLQAMSFLLGLQLAARNRDDEIRAVQKLLEPNQRRAVEETLEVLGATELLEELSLPPRDSWPEAESTPGAIAVYEPGPREAIEPPVLDRTQRNRGIDVYRTYNVDPMVIALGGAIFLFGITIWLLESLTPELARNVKMVVLAVASLAGGTLAAVRLGKTLCSDPSCRSLLSSAEVAVCPGCGGTVRGKASPRDLRRIQEERFEREAAAMEFEDCEDCQPEVPCARHA